MTNTCAHYSRAPRGCIYAGCRTAGAILSTVIHLEHLDVRGPSLGSRDVHSILCQARNLESFTLVVKYISNRVVGVDLGMVVCEKNGLAPPLKSSEER